MTPIEHNKYLGIAHLAYAGFHVLVTIAMMVFMGTMMSNIFSQARRMGDDSFPTVMPVILVLSGVLQVAFSIPPLVAGFAFLKRRTWAKVAGIAGGIVAAMSFPVGTALAVYTFWFLFSDTWKQVYENSTPKMPPQPPEEWQPNRRSAEDGGVGYTPPTKQT